MEQLPNYNLFMMCNKLNDSAFTKLPNNFKIRTLLPTELEIWKSLPFDDEISAKEYNSYMTNYFNNVYKPYEKEFYKRCFVVVDNSNKIVASAFIWKSYNQQLTTLHWLKTCKNYEGLGIGRALLTHILKTVKPCEFPIFLHTQPESFRAIKLYSDFGFKLLKNNKFGFRKNHLKQSLPYLKKVIPYNYFKNLKTTRAPKKYSNIIKTSTINQF